MRSALIAALVLVSLHCINARADTNEPAAPAGMDVLDYGETPEQAARRMGLPGLPVPVKKKSNLIAPDSPGYTPEDVLNSRGMSIPTAAAAPEPDFRGPGHGFDEHGPDSHGGHDSKGDGRESSEDQMGGDGGGGDHKGHKGRH